MHSDNLANPHILLRASNTYSLGSDPQPRRVCHLRRARGGTVGTVTAGNKASSPLPAFEGPSYQADARSSPPNSSPSSGWATRVTVVAVELENEEAEAWCESTRIFSPWSGWRVRPLRRATETDSDGLCAHGSRKRGRVVQRRAKCDNFLLSEPSESSSPL